MTADYDSFKVPIEVGINDIPIGPTDINGCNGAFYIERYNNAMTAVETDLGTKFDIPVGTTAQYVRGDGSLATLPTAGGPSGLLVNFTTEGDSTYSLLPADLGKLVILNCQDRLIFPQTTTDYGVGWHCTVINNSVYDLHIATDGGNSFGGKTFSCYDPTYSTIDSNGRFYPLLKRRGTLNVYIDTFTEETYITGNIIFGPVLS